MFVPEPQPDRRCFVAYVSLVRNAARLKHRPHVKLIQAMKHQAFGWPFVVGVILVGNTVAADDVKQATRHHASADLVRRTSSLSASATEAVSAATVATNQVRPAIVTNTSAAALPSLPPEVTELRFNEFFRQPIGPRGLEYTEKLRSLEG